MTSLPKVYYYSATGRGHQVRLALAAANIPFEDVHPECGFPPNAAQKAKWQTIGGNTTTNIPMLEMPNGKVYTQSSAVLKAIGRMKNGSLMPKAEDEYAQYQVDKLIADAEDVRTASYKCFRSWGASEESYQQYVTTVLPLHLGNFQRMLIDNGGVYFVGKEDDNQLTVADIAVYDAVVNYGANRAPEGCLDTFAVLKSWVERVEGNEGIKAYLASEQFAKIETKFNRDM